VGCVKPSWQSMEELVLDRSLIARRTSLVVDSCIERRRRHDLDAVARGFMFTSRR